MKTPADFPKLNLPPCRLRASERDGVLCVWDPARAAASPRAAKNSGWLVLTPEEWVRRHVLAFLSGPIPQARIVQEHPVEINGTTQRADIVVVGKNGRPQMLVECKAPSVSITDATLAQAFRYNAVLGARWVMLTNGLDHYIYEVGGGTANPGATPAAETATTTLRALKDFPVLE